MLTRFSSAINKAPRSKMLLATQAVRNYVDDLNLDANQLAERRGETEAREVDLWRNQAEQTKNSLVLKTGDEIESYVLSITKDYFRCTKKQALDLDSAFTDHGLDSLDVIELVIKVEDELGYLIDAENLIKFKKPRHFVNFIKQMEAYKEEFHRLPHDDTYTKGINWKEAFPGIPYLTK